MAYDNCNTHEQKRWQELLDHPLVGESRGIGVLGAIELTPDKASRAKFPGNGKVGNTCRDHCVDNGLVMRAVGDSMIISPPFVFDDSHVDELIEKATIALNKTAEDIDQGLLADVDNN